MSLSEFPVGGAPLSDAENSPAPPSLPELTWQPVYPTIIFKRKRTLLLTAPTFLYVPTVGYSNTLTQGAVFFKRAYSTISLVQPLDTTTPAPTVDLGWLSSYPNQFKRKRVVYDNVVYNFELTPVTPNLDWLVVYPNRFTRKVIKHTDNTYVIEVTAPPYSPTGENLVAFPDRFDRKPVQQDTNFTYFDYTVTPPAVDMAWVAVYPDRFNRKVISFENTKSVFAIETFPVPELSWEGKYPSRFNKRRITPNDNPEIFDLATPAVPELSWLSKYPDRIIKNRLHTNRIPFSDVRNLVPLPNAVPIFFRSENILPVRRKPFWAYQYFTGLFYYTDTPIPFNANRKLLAIVNESETWFDHFNSRGWANIADQIAAGYPIYAQPTLTSGSYEEVYDAGVIINNTVITLQYSTNPVVGIINVVSKLAVSDDGITFTPFNTGTTYFASSVRYVKFRLEFTTTGDKNLATYFNINLNLSTKREMDGGTVNVLAADVGGTVVNFNKAFKDVETITVTPLATVQETAIYDFVDIPNPTSFKILLYNTAGTRIDGVVSWKARGVV